MRQALPLVFLTLAACGGAKPDPQTPTDANKPVASADKPVTDKAAADKPAADKPAANAAPQDKHALAEAAPHDDPNEKEEPITLAPLVAKGTPKSAFPKVSVGDHDCLKEMPFTGKQVRQM